MRTLQFGIEIETVGISRQALAQAIHSVIAGPTDQPFDSRTNDNAPVIDARGRKWRVV
ncbi:MAG: amidoligase family protein, partial [Kofleriaceae bacterium]